MEDCTNNAPNPEFGVFPKLSAVLTRCFESLNRTEYQVIRLEEAVSVYRKCTDEEGEDMPKTGIAEETVKRTEFLLARLKEVEVALREQTNSLLGISETTASANS